MLLVSLASVEVYTLLATVKTTSQLRSRLIGVGRSVSVVLLLAFVLQTMMMHYRQPFDIVSTDEQLSATVILTTAIIADFAFMLASLVHCLMQLSKQTTQRLLIETYIKYFTEDLVVSDSR